MIVSSAIAGSGSCFIEYNRATNAIRLADDAGTTWPSPVTLGTGTAMSNSQCTLNPALSSSNAAANNLTLNVSLTFAAGYHGGKNLYVQAYDVNGAGSGWQTAGTWTVP